MNDSLVRPVTVTPHRSGDLVHSAKRFDRAVRTGEFSAETRVDEQLSGDPEGVSAVPGDEDLSPDLLDLFHPPMKSDLTDPKQLYREMLSGLLDDIAGAVKVGRQMPGDRWRLLLRLRHNILPQTELELACTGGEFSVVIRTSLETSFRLLVETVPQLNSELERRGLGPRCATVFWVGPIEYSL